MSGHGNLEQVLALPSLKVAPRLLGWTLCREVKGGLVKLKIVETEAYSQDDPASHSFRGVTTRTAPMFEAGGRLYIYFTYGMHYAVNIVTGSAGRGEAVLIRAAQPLEGIEIMRKNRGVTDIHNLANGPGKLAQAIGIKDTELSGKTLGKSSIYLEPPEQTIKASSIIAGPRIGISKAALVPWRFYIKDNRFVSKHLARQRLYNKTNG